MNASFRTNFSVFLALLQRSYKTIRSQLTALAFDGLVLICVNVTIFGYLFPAIGMHKEFIAPSFLGATMRLFFNIGYGLSLQVVNDIKFKRYIDYQLTLPISKNWLLASFVARFAAEIVIVTVPLLAIGIFLLSNKIPLGNANWIAFIGIYSMSAFFIATFFLCLSFLYPYEWFMRNLWPRRLSPMVVLSSALIPWKAIYGVSPWIAIPFLINPVTYISEGLRSALLGNGNYIPVMICITMLMLYSGLLWILLRYAFNKSLNPV